jgi:hypothetical protein
MANRRPSVGRGLIFPRGSVYRASVETPAQRKTVPFSGIDRNRISPFRIVE